MSVGYRKCLLLGAGFTKNFGGLLGEEMWNLIFKQPVIQSSGTLKSLMLRDPGWNYERIRQTMKHGPQSLPIEDVRRYEQAVQQAYSNLDRIIGSANHEHPINISKLHKELIERFRGTEREPGIIFSLNQDLWFERKWDENRSLVLPGILRGGKTVDIGQGRRKNYPLLSEDFLQLPTREELKSNPIENGLGNLALIKLHGSIDFLSALNKGEKSMVWGVEKKGLIVAEPLLDAYFGLFRKTLETDKLKLLVIGYGFGDSHINELLNAQATKGNLKIYVTAPTKPKEFIDSVLQRYKFDLKPFLGGFFPYSLKDVFPRHSDSETMEWNDIQHHFFEEKKFA